MNKCIDCKYHRVEKIELCVHPENTHYVYSQHENLIKKKMMMFTPYEKNSNGLCELFEQKQKTKQNIKINIKTLY